MAQSGYRSIMKIEFLEDVHTYVCDGVIIPSVSELIRFKFPVAYKDVPEAILKKKASYGSKVHKYIEGFVNREFTLDALNERSVDPNIKIAVERFEALRKEWAFYVEDMEQIVCYKGKYAGTYDIRTTDGLLIDIKTTTDLHEDWLKYQLGLYYLASGIDRDHGYVIWLPKGKAGCVKRIDVDLDECRELVEEYEKSHSSE